MNGNLPLQDNVNVFWFRRDLRLEDNVGLTAALNTGKPVLPIFIFDIDILHELSKNDARVTFIHEQLQILNDSLKSFGSSLLVLHNKPIDAWKGIIKDYSVNEVYFNKDYEPYGLARDNEIVDFLKTNGVEAKSFKDHVICDFSEVLKNDGLPYTIYTPYKNKWLSKVELSSITPVESLKFDSFIKHTAPFPELNEIGFEESNKKVKPYSINHLDEYETTRNFPSTDGTSYLGPHLRFGTVGLRTIIKSVKKNSTFVSELIWREFFIQILYHFPEVVGHNFKRKYDGIGWLNKEEDFVKWCKGNTGYPMVDAGMRQLNETGYIHNRVRMVVASFLCKHLLIDWKWGEAYFAKHLLDYELSSNNGNWQWAAGTGCDAAPYFRVFNPSEQLKKFDGQMNYTKKWVPELLTGNYAKPMVDHKKARIRAIDTYKSGISSS